MPYTGPQVQSHGGLIDPGTAAVVSENIQKSLARFREDRQKKEFNEGVFDYLSQQKDPQGEPYIPHESLAKWHSMNPDKQAGVLALAGAKLQADQKTVRHQKEALVLSDAEQAAAAAANKIPLRQSSGSITYADKPGTKPKDQDSMHKLSTELKDETGATFGDWSNAANKRMSPDGKFFMADVGGGTDDFGKPKAPKTVNIPVDRYHHFIARYKTLSGEDPAAADAGAAGAPAATAAPVTTQKVRVKSPDGKTGFIPAEQLQDALSAGYSQIQ